MHPSEDIARRKSSPTLMSATTKPSKNGSTDKGRQRRDKEDDRSKVEYRLVCFCRDDIFLEKKLDSVRKRLEKTERADLAGTEPHLHMGDDLALPVGCIGDMEKSNRNDSCDLQIRIMPI